MQQRLLGYVRDRFEDLPSDLEVSAPDAVGSDGWWIGYGEFSSHLESAVFLWSPEGEVSLAWSGSADSEYEIREYMLSLYRYVPPELFACVDVTGHF